MPPIDLASYLRWWSRKQGPTPWPVAPTSRGGSIEIEFAAGARMRITGAVNAATLKAACGAPRSTPAVIASGVWLWNATGHTNMRRRACWCKKLSGDTPQRPRCAKVEVLSTTYGRRLQSV